MDEAITETSETASSSEENDLPEQSLQKYSDVWVSVSVSDVIFSDKRSFFVSAV